MQKEVALIGHNINLLAKLRLFLHLVIDVFDVLSDMVVTLLNGLIVLNFELFDSFGEQFLVKVVALISLLVEITLEFQGQLLLLKAFNFTLNQDVSCKFLLVCGRGKVQIILVVNNQGLDTSVGVS